MPSLRTDVVLFGRLIKFSHTIFALPFALSMFVVVSRTNTVSGLQLGWIILAMIGARTAAMGFNRLVDRDADAINPRTQNREIPAGLIALGRVALLVAASAACFFLASGFLGLHCLVLSPVVLGILFLYSWTKRFTQYSHLVLGLSLALAPGGVWYALTGVVAILPIYFMLAVLFWVAGFDILYACQDLEFDQRQGLFSIPANWGENRAFLAARIFHVTSVGLFVLFGLKAGLGPLYFIGVALFATALISQHRLVSPGNLERIDAAFFERNGIGSVIFFLAVLLDRIF